VVVNAGAVWLTITVPELDRIEHVLEENVRITSPKTSVGSFSHKEISMNTVELTLSEVGAGTTLTWECICIGV